MKQPPKDIYPHFSVTHIKNPNKLYAFPILGIVVKVLMILPVAIEILVLGFALIFLSIFNSFYVLIYGKVLPVYSDLTIGFLALQTKVQIYIGGLTDKYPGFKLDMDDPLIKLDIETTSKPSKLFAFPVLGGLLRLVLLIPYIIYIQIIKAGAQLGVIVSFAPVLLKGIYPEATYELYRDYNRLNLSLSIYSFGLSDKYPNFYVDQNHLTTKIILIIIGIVLGIFNSFAPRNNLNERETQNFYPASNTVSDEKLPY